jgi:hypothetical protein
MTAASFVTAAERSETLASKEREMKSMLFAAALTLASSAALAQNPPTGSTVAPANNAPERDARGIPVVSAPATAPAGWNVPYGTGTTAPAGQAASPMGAAMDLPPCSRTVTDRCVQTYERGASR